MYISYLDESGSKNLKEKKCPWHVVVAVIARDAQFKKMVAVRNRIVKKLVPQRMRKNFEFHARELFRPRHHGDSIGYAKRRKLIERALLDIVVKLDLTVIYGAVNRPKLRQKYRFPDSPNHLAFTFCAERVEEWFCEKWDEEIGLFIADDTPDARFLRDAYRDYRTAGVTLGVRNIKLNHLLDSMCFSDSKDSLGVQMADLCAFFIAGLLNRKTGCEEFYDIFAEQIYASKCFPS